jgi:hypothetical protein
VTTNICRVCGTRTDQRSCPQCGATTVRSNLTAYLAGPPAGQPPSAGPTTGRSTTGGPMTGGPMTGTTVRGMAATDAARSVGPASVGIGSTHAATPGAAAPAAQAAAMQPPRSLTIHLRILLAALFAWFLVGAIEATMASSSDKPLGVEIIVAVVFFIVMACVGLVVMWPLLHGFGWTRITYICLYWMGVVVAALVLIAKGFSAGTVIGLVTQIAFASFAMWALTRPDAVAWYERHERQEVDEIA